MSSMKEMDAFNNISDNYLDEDRGFSRPFAGRKDLGEGTVDRLYQAWLQAYSTRQTVSETVTINHNISVQEKTLQSTIDRELQSIILEKKFQKQVDTGRIPFLGRIFSVPAEYQHINGESHQVHVIFNGNNPNFQEATSLLLRSLDVIASLVEKTKGLPKETSTEIS